MKPIPAGRGLLSVSEVAILLGEERSTLYRSIQRGDFPLQVVTINGRMRISRQAVERLRAGLVATSDVETAIDDQAFLGRHDVVPPSRRRPICVAARRSSSPIASV
jgi:excisionase family DNA binding protein